MIDGDADATLVARCLEGDASAFEPIVRRYQRVLYNVAFRMVGDREDARDIVQSAFVKAWEKLATFDPRHRFFSWMYRIVVNESSRHPSIPGSLKLSFGRHNRQPAKSMWIGEGWNNVLEHRFTTPFCTIPHS